MLTDEKVRPIVRSLGLQYDGLRIDKTNPITWYAYKGRILVWTACLDGNRIIVMRPVQRNKPDDKFRPVKSS